MPAGLSESSLFFAINETIHSGNPLIITIEQGPWDANKKDWYFHN